MNNIKFEVVNGKLSAKEEKEIVAYVNEHKKIKDSEIESIVVTKDEHGMNLDVKYKQNAPKIERIRRITGYLTGTTDTWNDAKRAEEHDRVKHA